MRIEGHRIWITLFIAIFIVSGYLYYSVRENQRQLTEQSIRSLALTKGNFIESWETLVRRPGWDKPSNFPDKTEPKTARTLRDLLEMMRPSDFFDFIMLSDTAGNVLITDPEISMEKISPTLYTEREQLGIIRTNMNISATDYQVFRVPVTFHSVEEGETDPGMSTLYLYGAISQERYNQAGWQISFTVLYLLGSLVIFVIVSYPILRLVGMGRGDILLRTHIYQIGLSIILLSVFIGFSVSYFSSRAEIVKDQHKTVTTLAESADTLHGASIGQYAALLKLITQGDSLPDTLPAYNEIITVNSVGVVTDITFGKPENEVPIDSLPNLRDRYYFQRAQVDTFFLGSHFSYLDGEQEGVLSTKIKNDDTDSAGVVNAITFSLQYLDHVDRDSLNSQGLKYLILNERGEKYYQSPYIKTVIPNLWTVIQEEEWQEIRALMQNNKDFEGAFEIPLSFEGQSYTGHLTRFNPGVPEVREAFWILTLRDKNLRYLRSFSVFMYSAAGYFFLIFILLIISLFSFMTRRSSHYLNIKPFSFDWLKPSDRKRKNYRFLFIVLLLHTIFFLFVVSRDLHNFWFVVLLFCETICFIALYGYLLQSDFLENWEKPASWKFPMAVFITSIILLFMAYRTSTFGGGNLIALILLLFLFQAAVLVIIAYMHKKGRFRADQNMQRSGLSSPETLFAVTFTLWVVMIGLFPGYAIHHFAFHFEDAIWENAATLDDHHDTDDRSQHVVSIDKMNHEDHVDNPGTENNQNVNKNNHTESFWSKVERRFFNQMEYQRRQWLGNYSGIDYPVIDRYIYADRQAIRNAFVHDHPGHGLETHDKGSLEYGLMFILIIIIVYLLFLLIRNLTRRIFLTHYWDFESKKGLVVPSDDELYIITLDNRKALKFLGNTFLKNKEFKIFDFAGLSVQEVLLDVQNNTPAADGFVFLNVEGALHSSETIHQLISLISVCRKNRKFVIITGTKSIKELREYFPEDPEDDKVLSMKNWVETVSNNISIILPFHYDVEEFKTDPLNNADYTLIDKVKEDIKYSPHEHTLAVILEQQLEMMGDKPFIDNDYEKFLLIIQRFNKAWYQNIWEKLSFREKQMVYNYANEGFVNHCNFDVLTELLQKGVFRIDPLEEKIGLFNQSFRNYATRAPSVELLKEFRRDRRENGNLKHLRNAMLTFVFLAILGVSLVAPEILDRYIGAISGGLAILSTLASALSKFSLKLPSFKGSEGG